MITHIPGGLIAERYGGKHVVGYGILGTALLTMLTPLAARHSPTTLIVVRFIEGLGEVSAYCMRTSRTIYVEIICFV